MPRLNPQSAATLDNTDVTIIEAMATTQKYGGIMIWPSRRSEATRVS
jgi:hypothetical protein